MKTKLLNVISLNVIETNNVLCVDTHIRLKSLNYCITLLYKADISSILHCFYKNIIQ